MRLVQVINLYYIDSYAKDTEITENLISDGCNMNLICFDS